MTWIVVNEDGKQKLKHEDDIKIDQIIDEWVKDTLSDPEGSFEFNNPFVGSGYYEDEDL
jgi:hypothetical protein